MSENKDKLYDLNELRQVSNGDDKFVKEMIDIFIRSTIDGMDKMEAAYQEKNYKIVCHYAHKIAPPCRHLGINSLLYTFKKIETGTKETVPDKNVENLILEARKEVNVVVKNLELELSKFK